MKLAAGQLSPQPDLVLIDGNKIFEYDVPAKSIVKGDSKSFAIASASILAKVTRDKYMKEISDNYPEYVWHKNKGYGTKEHIAAIKKYGPTQLHRRTFLGNILSEEQLNLAFNKSK
jgi:ribonuclease HII